MAKKVSWLLLLLTIPAWGQNPHTPIPGNNWVNVQDYGALGQGGDDAPGFVAAINAAASGHFGGGTVYCPSTAGPFNTYQFPHGITLPNLGNVWVELSLDCNITLGGPIVVNGNGYYIHGHNGAQRSSFSTQAVSQIYANDGISPAISIASFGARLENLSVSTGSGDAILITGNTTGIDASSMVSLIEVHASTRYAGAAGSPLHIVGGFGYYVEGGGFEVQPTTNQPTILIETPSPKCVGTGIITLERIYLANHGIQLKSPCGYIQTVKIRAALYEQGQDALVSLKGAWPGIITGIKIEDCAIADTSAEVVNNQASRVFGVKIDGCPVTGGVLTTGSPIGMLTVWYPVESATPPTTGFSGIGLPRMPKIAQTRNYELHFGDRIINTIPVLNMDKWDTQQGFVQNANPPD